MGEPNLFIYNNFNFELNNLSDLNTYNIDELSFLKEPKPVSIPLMKDASTQTDFKDYTLNNKSSKNIKSNSKKTKFNKLYCLTLNKDEFNKLNKFRKRRVSNNISAAISRRKFKLKMRDITDILEKQIKSEIDVFIAKRKELFGLNTRYDYDKE